MATDVVRSGGPSTPPTPGFGSRVVTFYNGVMAEMRRVTWPDFPQVRSATIAIIIFVLAIALLITALDAILSGLLVSLLPGLFAR
jgi:preprotein translocase subunit SecE